MTECRIADVVAERAPGAELAADPFHAVSRATGALDELRRRSWREAGSRPAPKRRRGRARPPARPGVQVQDTGVRRAVEEGQAQARRDPALHRARRLQRPRGGREQQDKGRDQAGLRLKEHGRPDRPHHAQVLGPEAGAAGEGGFVIPTHTNSRSLVNIADLFHRPWRVSF